MSGSLKIDAFIFTASKNTRLEHSVMDSDRDQNTDEEKNVSQDGLGILGSKKR